MDIVISDMVKYTNFKTLSYTAKLRLEQFGLDGVIEQYKLQRHQAAQPVTPQPSSNARLPLPVDDDASDEVPAMSDQDRLQQKEEDIIKERKKHAQMCMEEMVTLMVRPLTKEAMKQIMGLHFIAKRDKK